MPLRSRPFPGERRDERGRSSSVSADYQILCDKIKVSVQPNKPNQDFIYMTSAGIFSLMIFLAVIILLMIDKIQMTILALSGALLLVLFNIFNLEEAINYIAQNYNTLALFLGIMIMVRAFQPTRVFEWLAGKIVVLSGGKGSRLIIGLILLTSVCSAFLPNATVVLLLGPIIPPLAMAIGVDFVPLLILIVLSANSAGLLTLVGDPVQFIVASAINISFISYLTKLSLTGVLSVVVLGLLLPVLFRQIWRSQITNIEEIPQVQINHRGALSVGVVITLFVLIFFVIGQSLSPQISPATVALAGATLTMLLFHQSKIETVSNILKDVDWSTLIFFMSFFAMTGALEHTGVIEFLSEVLAKILGNNITINALIILFVVGLLSSLVPNIPLVAALVPLVQQFVVNTNLATSEILSPSFQGQLAPEILPLFYAIILGGTLGGNGTLMGASANLVAAGVADQYGKSINFKTFLKYGLPVMFLQLIASAMYLLIVR